MKAMRKRKKERKKKRKRMPEKHLNVLFENTSFTDCWRQVINSPATATEFSQFQDMDYDKVDWDDTLDDDREAEDQWFNED